MHVRAYLRASTKEQDAWRARGDLEAFCAHRGLVIAASYVENESGASLQRPSCFACWPTAGRATCCWSSRWTG